MSLCPDFPKTPPRALKAALESLANELQSPSRLSACVSQSGISDKERLQETLSELCSREKDLLAAVSIALVILDGTEATEKELQATYAEEEQLQAELAAMRLENQRLSVRHTQETAAVVGTRCARLETELATTEKHLERTQQFARQMQEDSRSAKANCGAEESREESAGGKRGTEELKTAMRGKRKVEKENETLRKENDALRDALYAREATNRHLENELRRSRSRVSSLTESTQCLTRRLSLSEDTRKYLEFDLALALRKVEKLEEDLRVLLLTPPSDALHGRHTSLVSKLPGIEESEESDTASDSEAQASSGPSQCSYRREISADFGYETADEELFGGKKEAPVGLREVRKRCSFFALTTVQVDRLPGVDIWGRGLTSRRTVAHRPQSILALVLRSRRVWSLLRFLYSALCRFLRNRL